ncbi:MAG: hypothetical protein R2793_07060 [Flavobacteriaceae bacterium]
MITCWIWSITAMAAGLAGTPIAQDGNGNRIGGLPCNGITGRW